jgi:hypothetical protein
MRRVLAALLPIVAVAIAGCGSSAPAPTAAARPTRAGVARNLALRPTLQGHVAHVFAALKSAGAPTVGEVLTTTNGTWTNNPTSYTYQWQHCPSGINCVNINGATSASYTIASGDTGDTIVVVVTAHNAGGQAAQTSAATGTVTGGGGGGLVPCALTYAAGADPNTSCWATHTGVLNGTGCTEAQIVAQGSGPCGPVGNGSGGTFTVMTGDPTYHSIVISASNTTIDHVWAQGACFEIHDNISNVVIKNTLITGGNVNCGGDGAGGTTVNTGQGATIATNSLMQDVTIDGGVPADGSHSAAITFDGGEVLRVNISGYAQGFISDSNTAANPALFQDDYGHGYTGCTHDDGTWFNSSSYVTMEHSYILMGDPWITLHPGNCTTGAFAGGSDYGPADHVTYDNSYANGADGEAIHTGCLSTPVTITNNAVDNGTSKFGSDGGYQALTGNTWSGNYAVDHNTGANLGSWGPFGAVC